MTQKMNFEIHQRLTAAVLEHTPMPPGGELLELYSGVGTFSLALASAARGKARMARMRCVEVSPECAAPFAESRTRLRERFPDAPELDLRIARAQDDPAEFLAGAETVLVDPPRKGLHPDVLAALDASPDARALVYVSCSHKTLKRDVADLVQRGWALKHAETFQMFPGVAAVETLAVLERG